MVWKEASQTAPAGTHGRWGFPLRMPRGAGWVPGGTGVRPAWRSSRRGAGSTCGEKESPTSRETCCRPLLSYPKRTLQATLGEEVPAFASSSCSESPRSCSSPPHPRLSPFSASPQNPFPAPAAPVHPLGLSPSSSAIPVTSAGCCWHDPTGHRAGIRGERRLASPPSPKLVPFLLLPVASSAFCKASEDAAGAAHKPWGYPVASVSHPGASVSHPGQLWLYRSIEALDVPLPPHPE